MVYEIEDDKMILSKDVSYEYIQKDCIYLLKKVIHTMKMILMRKSPYVCIYIYRIC